MEVMELLTQAVEQNAADIFLVPGMPFSYKIGGRIICQGEEKIMPDQLDQMITRIYEIAKNRSMERVLSHGDDDFSFAIPSNIFSSATISTSLETRSLAGRVYRSPGVLEQIPSQIPVTGSSRASPPAL